VLDRQSRAIVASNSFISDDQCSFSPEDQALYGASTAAVGELLHSALFGRFKGTTEASPAARRSLVFPSRWLATADEDRIAAALLQLLAAAREISDLSPQNGQKATVW
jgi:hypothetical protein